MRRGVKKWEGCSTVKTHVRSLVWSPRTFLVLEILILWDHCQAMVFYLWLSFSLPAPTISVLHAHQNLVTLLSFLCPLPGTRSLCLQPSAHGMLLQSLSFWSILPHPFSFPHSGVGIFWRNSLIPVGWGFCQLMVSTLSEHPVILLSASAILWSGQSSL